MSPEASLSLLLRQRQLVSERLDMNPAALLVPWGIAWLVGYALFFLRFGPGDRALVDMPPWLPLVVLFTLLAAAGAVTGFLGARAYSGIAGESAERGAMYGWSWSIAFAGFVVLALRFEDHLPPAWAGLLWGSVPALLTGVLYLTGGAVWRDRQQFALGAWLSVVNVVGLVAGPGWHSLVVALGGGGGFLVAAAVLGARHGRTGPRRPGGVAVSPG